MNFLPLKGNITRGLMVNLTGGYKCFHKGRSNYVEPSTSILMECDLGAGVGFPEPRSNLTGEFKGGTLDLDPPGEFFCNV